MLNKYPLWKYLLILAVLAVGFIYSAPNLYPDDPAVQISGASTALQVTQADVDRAAKALTDAGIAVKADSLSKKGGLIRLVKQDDQLPAKEVVRRTLGDDYVVALNLAQTTPEWLRKLGGSPMKLGLDLSGGVHFLLEVDMDKAVDARLKVYESEVKSLLRKERVRYRSLPIQDRAIQLGFTDSESLDKARSLIAKDFRDFEVVPEERNGLQVLRVALTQAKLAEIREYSIKQNLTTVRNRVNELGVSEPLVQRQGANRIVVELPGVQDTAEAKRILGKTANLEFRLAAEPDALKSATETFEFREAAPAAGAAGARGDHHRRPGHRRQRQFRRERPPAGEHPPGWPWRRADEPRHPQQRRPQHGGGVHRAEAGDPLHQADGRWRREGGRGSGVQEEKQIISLATIQSPLGNQFRITGLDGPGESSELALLLRAGGLAAPMYFAEERTIGPSLGADNIAKGIDASLWGMLFVSLFIIVIYRFFGVIATVALAFNMVMLVALMSILGATLTLPGIAGIVLTMGMAVDANVLIFSRIREELANGMSVQRAIHEGFNRAFTAILDANLTSLLVGGILLRHGHRPGERICRDHVARHHHLDVHGHHGHPRNGQPDLRRA